MGRKRNPPKRVRPLKKTKRPQIPNLLVKIPGLTLPLCMVLWLEQNQEYVVFESKSQGMGQILRYCNADKLVLTSKSLKVWHRRCVYRYSRIIGE